MDNSKMHNSTDKSKLEEKLDSLAVSISQGSHPYDVLPQVRHLNTELNLGLPSETIRLLQLDIIFKSMAIHYWNQSEKRLCVPANVKEAYLSALLKTDIVNDYDTAKNLIDTGIKYYELVQKTHVSESSL